MIEKFENEIAAGLLDIQIKSVLERIDKEPSYKAIASSPEAVATLVNALAVNHLALQVLRSK